MNLPLHGVSYYLTGLTFSRSAWGYFLAYMERSPGVSWWPVGHYAAGLSPRYLYYN